MIIKFSNFLRYICGPRGNKISKIFISRKLTLWTDFKAARKIRKRFIRRNLFLHFIFVKLCPNLIGKFFWNDIYLCWFHSNIFFIFLSLIKCLQTLLEIHVVLLLVTSGFIVTTSCVSGLPVLPAIFYNIFIQYSSYYELICRLSQTLIIHEPNNSVRKPESTNRTPLT